MDIRILNIETSTDICSVSVSINGECTALKVSERNKSHSQILGVFIKDILLENNLKPSDFSAVAISSGPGSYTGLRIGVSTAKGFCFGANIPLIAIDTMEIMTIMAINKQILKHHNDFFIPMIDARRMEVYTAIYNNNIQKISSTEALILDQNSFDKYSDYKINIFGDGAEKALKLISHEKIVYIENIYPSAEYMCEISNKLYNKNVFVDVIYFEPFYLKDFVATTPKNKVL